MTDKRAALLVSFILITLIVIIFLLSAYSGMNRCINITELIGGTDFIYNPKVGCLIQQTDWSYFGN